MFTLYHNKTTARTVCIKRLRLLATLLMFTLLISTIFISTSSFLHAASNKPGYEPYSDLPSSSRIASSPTIVVTIKPVYSLVAHLTEGITTPVLLSDNIQSPHHYNMRPSERRLIANADMLIWIGPQMESYLSKIIRQQNKPGNVALIQTDGLTLLHKRSKHSHQKEHNDISQDLHAVDKIDQHIWLSSANAKVISEYTSEKLISQDPENTEHYEQNLKNLLNKIDQTDKSIHAILKGNTQPFIVAHDAFQYFEKEYGLNYIAAINTGDESSTSLKHLTEIKSVIEKNDIQCVIYQPPKPAIINALTRNTKIKTIALDPLGLDLKDQINDQANYQANNRDAWFEIMQRLALGFNQCLSQ